MKKLFVICLSVFSMLTAFGQKVKEAQVPATVKASFQKKFTGAKEVKWEKEDGKFEANFEQNNNEMSALFSNAGMLEETESEIKKSELPPAVVSYLNSNYKGIKIKETAKLIKANGEVNFEAQIKNMDLIFDVNGKLIKTLKKVKE